MKSQSQRSTKIQCLNRVSGLRTSWSRFLDNYDRLLEDWRLCSVKLWYMALCIWDEVWVEVWACSSQAKHKVKRHKSVITVGPKVTFTLMWLTSTEVELRTRQLGNADYCQVCRQNSNMLNNFLHLTQLSCKRQQELTSTCLCYPQLQLQSSLSAPPASSLRLDSCCTTLGACLMTDVFCAAWCLEYWDKLQLHVVKWHTRPLCMVCV